MLRRWRREANYRYHVVRHRMTQFIASVQATNSHRRHPLRRARQRQQVAFDRDVRSRASSIDSNTLSILGSENSNSETSISDGFYRSSIRKKKSPLPVPESEDACSLTQFRRKMPNPKLTRQRSSLTMTLPESLRDKVIDSRRKSAGGEGSEPDPNQASGTFLKKKVERVEVDEFGYFSPVQFHHPVFGSEVSLSSNETSEVISSDRIRETRNQKQNPKKVQSHREEIIKTGEGEPVPYPAEIRGESSGIEEENEDEEVIGKVHFQLKQNHSSARSRLERIGPRKPSIKEKLSSAFNAIWSDKSEGKLPINFSRHKIIPEKGSIIFSFLNPKRQRELRGGEIPPLKVGLATGIVVRNEPFIRTKRLKKLENRMSEKEDEKDSLKIFNLISNDKTDGLGLEFQSLALKGDVAGRKVKVPIGGISQGVGIESPSSAYRFENVYGLKENVTGNYFKNISLQDTLKFLDRPEPSVAKTFYPRTPFTAQFATLLPNGKYAMNF